MEIVERTDKGKDREIVEKKCNNKQSKIDIKDREDGMEWVENAMETLVSSVQPTE